MGRTPRPAVSTGSAFLWLAGRGVLPTQVGPSPTSHVPTVFTSSKVTLTYLRPLEWQVVLQRLMDLLAIAPLLVIRNS